MALAEIDVYIKRASLLSDTVYGVQSSPRSEGDKDDEQAPEDKFYLANLFAFFSGMTGMIPITFFLTANDYWMYKLRDPAYPTYDLNHKTFLQKMFVSVNSIGTAIPSIISVLLTIKFGHKINLRNSFLITLGTISVFFMVFTTFVKINTDSWQTLFFALSLSVIGLISFFLPFYGIAIMAFLSRFPLKFMNINLFGTAAGGLFGSTLQVISLSIGHDSTEIALIYFGSGTVIIILTFFLAYFSKYSPVIEFYSNERSDKPKKRLAPTLKEYKEAIVLIWPLLVMFLTQTVTVGMGHPNITSLVVSERYVKDGDNLWYDKYFVTVATFFSYDFFQLFGRFFSGSFITKSNYWWWILINIGRAFVLTPLLLFCNAQPRQHLPVWLPHDYQYMIIMAVYSLLLSILSTSQNLSVPNFAGDKSELGYMVVMGTSMLTATLFSPLSSLIVSIL